jgi:hypothetical protein
MRPPHCGHSRTSIEKIFLSRRAQVLRASLEKPELSCSGCLFATPPARRPGLTRSAALGLAVRADIHWLLDGIPPDE